MGYYIETASSRHKADWLIKNHNAIVLPDGNSALQAIKDGKGVVCVVDNGPFEAAAFVYSEQEHEDFNYQGDYRPKTWLAMDLGLVKELSGYNR